MREGPCSVDEQVYIPTRYSDSNRIVVAQAGGWQCHSGDSAAARPLPARCPPVAGDSPTWPATARDLRSQT